MCLTINSRSGVARNEARRPVVEIGDKRFELGARQARTQNAAERGLAERAWCGTRDEAGVARAQIHFASVLRHHERVAQVDRDHDIVMAVVGGFLRPAVRRRIHFAPRKPQSRQRAQLHLGAKRLIAGRLHVERDELARHEIAPCVEPRATWRIVARPMP
jgi:hypothetical protein